MVKSSPLILLLRKPKYKGSKELAPSHTIFPLHVHIECFPYSCRFINQFKFLEPISLILALGRGRGEHGRTEGRGAEEGKLQCVFPRGWRALAVPLRILGGSQFFSYRKSGAVVNASVFLLTLGKLFFPFVCIFSSLSHLLFAFSRHLIRLPPRVVGSSKQS